MAPETGLYVETSVCARLEAVVGWKGGCKAQGIRRCPTPPGISPASSCFIIIEGIDLIQRGNTFCDATRMSDGAYVVLKIVKPSRHPYEAVIGAFVSSDSEAFASDPRNHCAQLYHVLTVPDEDDKILLVLPLLRDWASPKFETVGEGVDFFRQILEVRVYQLHQKSSSVLISSQGVQFMHKHHLAHRYISSHVSSSFANIFPQRYLPIEHHDGRSHVPRSLAPHT